MLLLPYFSPPTSFQHFHRADRTVLRFVRYFIWTRFDLTSMLKWIFCNMAWAQCAVTQHVLIKIWKEKKVTFFFLGISCTVHVDYLTLVPDWILRTFGWVWTKHSTNFVQFFFFWRKKKTRRGRKEFYILETNISPSIQDEWSSHSWFANGFLHLMDSCSIA